MTSSVVKLEPGQRLQGSGRSIYVVDEPFAEDAWSCLYGGRKVFFNYRYARREFYEANEDEWIEVLIRAPKVPQPGSSAERDARTQFLIYEGTEVLPDRSQWFPEPLDWIEPLEPPAETSKSTTASAGGAPMLLVLSQPHGWWLGDWAPQQPPGSSRALRAAAEIFDMLESLHEKRQFVGAIGPRSFLIDDAERISCLASDRIIGADQSAHWCRAFPTALYPADFAPPELLGGNASLDARGDLFSWASLAVFLITGQLLNREQGLAALEAAVQTAAAAQSTALWALAPQALQSGPADLAAGWVRCLSACLQSDPAKRPKSAREARQLVERSAASSKGSFWQRLAGSKGHST